MANFEDGEGSKLGFWSIWWIEKLNAHYLVSCRKRVKSFI